MTHYFMKNQLLPFIFAFCAFLSSAKAQNAPYLMAKGNSQDLQNLSLEKTAYNIAINGVVAEVKFTQTYIYNGKESSIAIYHIPTQTDIRNLRIFSQSGKIIAQDDLKMDNYVQSPYLALNLGYLMPNQLISINYEYTELVKTNQTIFEFTLPALIAPKLEQNVTTEQNTWIANPHLNQKPFQLEIMTTLQSATPIQDIACASHPVKVVFKDARHAEIQFGGASSEKLDFVLRYRFATATENGLNRGDTPKEDKTVLKQSNEEILEVKQEKSKLDKDETTLKHHLTKPTSIFAIEHEAVEGDYLYKIAKNYDVTMEDLRKWNKLEKDELVLGQKLLVYADFISEIHAVKENESLYQIAIMYGVKLSDLLKWNQLKNDDLKIGQKLLVYVLAHRKK